MFETIIELIVQEVIPQDIITEAKIRLHSLNIFAAIGEYECSKCITRIDKIQINKLLIWVRCKTCNITLPFEYLLYRYERGVKDYFYQKDINSLNKEELVALYYTIVSKTYLFERNAPRIYIIDDKKFIEYLLPKCKELFMLAI